jgi:hypothetical protein
MNTKRHLIIFQIGNEHKISALSSFMNIKFMFGSSRKEGNEEKFLRIFWAELLSEMCKELTKINFCEFPCCFGVILRGCSCKSVKI